MAIHVPFMCPLEGLSTKACESPCALSALSLAAQGLTVVVKAVRDLVPDDHSYAAVIQRFGLGGAEERGLQDARREDWKKATAQLRPCLAVLQVQWDQTTLWASTKTTLFPSISQQQQVTDTGECCRTGGAEQQDHSPLQTLPKPSPAFALLLFCSAEKAVCSNLHHLAFIDFCLIIKQTSQHCEKWEGVPQEE